MKASIKLRLTSLLLIAMMLISAIPAIAADKPDDGVFKVLFIGNSFSDDATDGGYFPDSTLYAMLESMLGEGNAMLGLAMSGGKNMAWHASMAKKDSASYSFFYTDSKEGWNYIDVRTSASALSYTEWDVVVLQPYGQELTEGYTSSIEGVLNEFSTLDASVPYMIDHVAKNAPQSDIYLHFPWSVTTSLELGSGNDDYKKIAASMRTIETYKGTESGKEITSVIPFGTAVQAIRYTYAAALDYNASAIQANNISPETDPQMGIQRDGVHLSFGIGRYLVNLVAAEWLVPEAKRINGYTLPSMRISKQVGELPADYAELVRVAADAAYTAAAGTGNGKYTVRKISGYEKSPITVLKEAAAEAITVGIPAGADKAAAENAIASTLRRISGGDVNAAVTIDGAYSAPAAGAEVSLKASVSLKHGYESAELKIDVKGKLGHTVAISGNIGGKLSDTGSVTVPAGEAYTVTFTPDKGYEVLDVKIDGKSVGAVESCTFDAVDADHGIEVTFAQANPFKDVIRGKWYYEGVMYVSSRGYMKGTNTELTEFSPSMEFTREQFVQLLFNMEGLSKEANAGDTGFSDVPAGKWYSAAVKWAKEAGVTSGIGGGEFGLGGKVSREQLAKFLMNYAEMKRISTDGRADLSGYSDFAKVSKWAKDAVMWAVSEGLIGSTDTSALVLSPGRVAVRSEIASIVMRFDKNVLN